ncbi:MAG: EthD family reductase [Bryobacteraceae bacterium]
MAQVLVLYNAPADPAAFDRYYRETHIPLAHKIPGLRSYTVSSSPVQALAGSAPYLVAILTFDSMADIHAALVSPEGQATAADLQNFASGGATLLMYDHKAV